ncbi:hypothetical protein ONZ45_g19069 [Pleurotus djamor]|nr:hypothetical protein ONZ45_g19069 [Pleurotus djamor]
MYFSQSNPNLSVPESTLPPVPQSPSAITVRTKRSQSSPANPMSSLNDLSSLASNLSSDEDTLPHPRPRLSSQSSSCSSSSRDSHGSIISSTSYILPDDASIIIDHNGKLPSDYTFISNRTSARGLEALPEDTVLPAKGNGGLRPPSASIRPRRTSSAADSNRVCHIYGTPPASAQTSRTSLDSQRSIPRRIERESILSVASGTSIIDNLSIMLPSEDDQLPDRRMRDSVSSIATFMTSNSAEAIMPLSLPSSRRPQSRLRPFSVSSADDDEDDFIDPYLYDEFPMPEMMESPPRSRYAPTQAPQHARPQTASSIMSASSTQSSLFPPSPTGSSFTAISATSQSPSVSSSVSPLSSYSVKAAFGATIVLLRVPNEASLAEFRHRLYNKFADQGVSLPERFVVYLVIPSSPVSNPRVRDRSNSLASVSTVDQTRMRVVHTEQDWNIVVSSSSMDGAKLTFRLMDPASLS